MIYASVDLGHDLASLCPFGVFATCHVSTFRTVVRCQPPQCRVNTPTLSASAILGQSRYRLSVSGELNDPRNSAITAVPAQTMVPAMMPSA
jgi:hypothetical protein